MTRADAPIGVDSAPGVAFPVTEGRRSTAATGQAVVADAVRGVDAELADEVLGVRDWRSGYLEPFRRMTELDLGRSDAAAGVSKAGLASVHQRFVFRRPSPTRRPP